MSGLFSSFCFVTRALVYSVSVCVCLVYRKLTPAHSHASTTSDEVMASRVDALNAFFSSVASCHPQDDVLGVSFVQEMFLGQTRTLLQTQMQQERRKVLYAKHFLHTACKEDWPVQDALNHVSTKHGALKQVVFVQGVHPLLVLQRVKNREWDASFAAELSLGHNAEICRTRVFRPPHVCDVLQASFEDCWVETSFGGRAVEGFTIEHVLARGVVAEKDGKGGSKVTLVCASSSSVEAGSFTPWVWKQDE
jgi:hypothetical protein